MARHTSSPEAHSKAMTKYIKKNYDRIEIRFTKESKVKEKILNHTAITGESINAFIYRAICETIDNDVWAPDEYWTPEIQAKLRDEFDRLHPELNKDTAREDEIPF